MDRNTTASAVLLMYSVALRKESVDRNSVPFRPASHLSVALRKESVDRNSFGLSCADKVSQSLSARRAWIEIITQIKTVTGCVVALRKESVDRNLPFGRLSMLTSCRSPQGERG